MRPAAENLPETKHIQVVIAACAGKLGRVGIAYVDLDAAERVLYVTDLLDPEFSQLSRVKHSVITGRRGVCIVPSRSPPVLLQKASEPLSAGEETFAVAVLKAVEFELESCRQRLLLLRMGGNGTNSDYDVRAQGIFDGSNEQLTRAAGGIVRFLEKNRAQIGDLDDPKLGLHVHDIRVFSPDSVLWVDEQTMSALQVFQDDPHPSAAMGSSGRAKEGISLFGLLEPLVASVAGRSSLRRWLLQPSRDMNLLRERQDAIDELNRPRHTELLREVHRELHDVREMQGILRRIVQCFHFDNVNDWRLLSSTLEHMSSAFTLMQSSALAKSLKFLKNVGELADDVGAVSDLIHQFVDFEASASFALLKIREGVHSALDAVREQYDNVSTYLTQVAQLERQRLKELNVAPVNHLTFHYFPQLGFHVSVPNPLTDDGDDEDPRAMERMKRDMPAPVEDWRYQFAGSGRLFYKCPLATRLDAEIGDLVVAARDIELELLNGVVARLRRFAPRLCTAAQLLAELDVLVGLATASKQFRWKRPRLSEDAGRLLIVQGRHPLVEATLSAHHKFVPNDTALGVPPTMLPGGGGEPNDVAAEGKAESRVQVVSGANFAGKSVYLKQVGLIVILAQIGCPVPANEAEIGLCDFLFSRIHSRDSVAVRRSTFCVDVAQVASALRHSTRASLVLLDEFGKGTHAADGVALFGATIQYLCHWRNGPKTIATTHFMETFRCELVASDEPALELRTMRVLPPKDTFGDVTYLYQLVQGVAERSFGIECAKKAGLDESTLARATEILHALERGTRVPAPRDGLCAEAAARALERAQKRELVCQQLVDRLCSMDVDDEEAVKSLLAEAWAQQSVICETAQ